MTRIWLLCWLVACGGSAKPATIANQGAGSAESGPTGTAKVIERSVASGVLELEGDRGRAMEAAVSEMAKHCDKDQYLIAQEGEEAGGWRIHYQCLHGMHDDE